LPFPDSERIVSLQTIEYPHAEAEAKEANVGTLNDVSFPDFFDWRRQSQALEAVASYSYGTVRKFTPRGNGLPRIVDAEYVSADFFRVLGVAPVVGRSFTLEDESDDSRPVILSYPFWVAEFHSSPDIVGKHVTISDRVATVIGVLPAGFTFPGLSEPPSFWLTFLRASLSGVSASGMPQKESVSPLSERTDRNTQVIGRLRRGVNVAQARAELNAIQRRPRSSMRKIAMRMESKFGRCSNA
jgi:putative ABC transport system permease protein